MNAYDIVITVGAFIGWLFLGLSWRFVVDLLEEEGAPKQAAWVTGLLVLACSFCVGVAVFDRIWP